MSDSSPQNTTLTATSSGHGPKRARGVYNAHLQRIIGERAKMPLLSKGHELRLAKKAQSGDQRARTELVERNMRLVASVALKHTGYGTPLEDMIQEGTIGLITAIDKFDPDRGYRLSTYATWWIRQAVGRALSNTGRTIRLPVYVGTNLGKISRAESRLRLLIEGKPTVKDIAMETGLTEETVELTKNLPMASVSLDSPTRRTIQESTSTAITLSDSLKDETPEAEIDTFVLNLLEKENNRRHLRYMISTLPTAQQSILLLRFRFRTPQSDKTQHTPDDTKNGRRTTLLPLPDIAGELQITVEDVSKNLSKAVDTLKKIALSNNTSNTSNTSNGTCMIRKRPPRTKPAPVSKLTEAI